MRRSGLVVGGPGRAKNVRWSQFWGPARVGRRGHGGVGLMRTPGPAGKPGQGFVQQRWAKLPAQKLGGASVRNMEGFVRIERFRYGAQASPLILVSRPVGI